MRRKQSKAWRNAEYVLAKKLRDAGIPAKRVSRDRYSKDYDVKIDGADFLKLDSKYTAAARFKHHGLIRTIAAKYCLEKDDQPILFTKNYKEHCDFVTVTTEFFAEMLAAYLYKIGKLAPMGEPQLDLFPEDEAQPKTKRKKKVIDGGN